MNPDNPTDHISADPGDLSHEGPESPGATTGIDSPLRTADGAEAPVVDPVKVDDDDVDLS